MYDRMNERLIQNIMYLVDVFIIDDHDFLVFRRGGFGGGGRFRRRLRRFCPALVFVVRVQLLCLQISEALLLVFAVSCKCVGRWKQEFLSISNETERIVSSITI